MGGIMIPYPFNPIYPYLISLSRAKEIGYYLDEENGWTFTT
jgi:aspartate/methionine/tyrosine aminotransferase